MASALSWVVPRQAPCITQVQHPGLCFLGARGVASELSLAGSSRCRCWRAASPIRAARRLSKPTTIVYRSQCWSFRSAVFAVTDSRA